MAIPAQMYLIALLPSQKVRKEIKAIKEDFRDNYKAKHALKLPAHITLQRPFWVPDGSADLLKTCLHNFSQNQSPLFVGLTGFDCFSARVIFVRIDHPEPLVNLQADLQSALPSQVFFREKERQTKPVHPHITVATRDLSPQMFKKAWARYKHTDYTNEFTADQLVLFRHDGKAWHHTGSFSFPK